MKMEVTRYGSSADTPAQAAALLRIFAIRAGYPVTKPLQMDPVNLVAAVIVADAWCYVTKARFTDVQHHGRGAAEVLSAAFLRAAGRDHRPAVVQSSSAPYPDGLAEAVSAWVEWAQAHLGESAIDAINRAAGDLARCTETGFVQVAEALAGAIDQPQLH